MQEIEIREILPGDAEQTLIFTRKTGGESDNLTFGEEGLPITLSAEQEYLQSVHEDEHSVMMGAFAGKRLIGSGSLSGMPRRMSHRAELGLSVRKEYWNQGIGSRLLESLIRYARENRIELIYLDVRSDNSSAIHLYKKYGFRKTGSYPAYFKIGDAYYDFDLMVLDLRNISDGHFGKAGQAFRRGLL
ncbi:MAG: GNAT family N-acetyltransferase [Bilifractor sp.]|jgi:RimJ/RimL family protein N-acetyltransferase